jgi:colanic acid/amylovoran biosynthesis protein
VPAEGAPDRAIRHFVTIGAALSANKGAASMAQAILDAVPRAVDGAIVEIASTYPAEDREEYPEIAHRIVSLTPRQLVFPVLPIAMLTWLVRRLGLSGRVPACWHPATRSLHRADVVLDLAGISFSDGRGFPILAYNVLMTGVPLMVGGPVIKCSQAIGPFDRALNRRAARLVLPRLRRVMTRGARTHQHALQLGLENAEPAADLAFLMETPPAARERADAVLQRLGVASPFLVLSPSSVVRRYCDGIGIDYVATLADLTKDVRRRLGIDVVIVPHSARPGQPESRMNDLPVCREIRKAVGDDPQVHLVDESLRPTELRALIARSDALITSRFHAMISGLATMTPVLVVGWSHKYDEVLRAFDLAEHALTYEQLDVESLAVAVTRLWGERAALAERIAFHLAEVQESARRNIDVIAEALAGTSHR